MIEIPGLGPNDELPAGDAQAKVAAWLELLRRDPMVNMAINTARMMGAGGVLEELETATSSQIERGIADVVTQLERLRGDFIAIEYVGTCAECSDAATWLYDHVRQTVVEYGAGLGATGYCSKHGPSTPGARAA